MCGGSSFHRRRFLAGVPRSTSSGSINLWIHRLRRTFGAVFGRGCGGRRSVCATPLYRYLCMPQLLYVCSFCMLCFCIPRRLPSEWRLLHTTSGYTKNPRFRRTGDRWCARRDSNACSSLRISSTRRGNRYYYTDVLEGVQAEKLEICPNFPPKKPKIPRFAAEFRGFCVRKIFSKYFCFTPKPTPKAPKNTPLHPSGTSRSPSKNLFAPKECDARNVRNSVIEGCSGH